MKVRRVVLWVTLASAVAGCGGGRTGSTPPSPHTVTVTSSASAPAAAARPRKTRTSSSSASSSSASSGSAGFVACDSNISAKIPPTTCPFAENVFYEYWKSGRASSVTAYSPGAGSTFSAQCSTGAEVVCTTSTGAAVRFASSAVDAYSQSQADQYAQTHSVGPGTSSASASGGGSAATGSGSGCTPGYSPCLAPASDYDCAGGSGNGPKYVQGPVQVTGDDPYGLDSNGDGVACTS